MILISLHDAAPDWFTDVLRAANVLPTGSVVSAVQQANAAFNSSVGRFTLSYSADAPAEAPRHLLLKLNADHAGEAEAAFYQYIMRHNPPLKMLPRAYAASYDAQTGASCLVLQSLSPTHSPPVTREQLLNGEGVPSLAQLGAIVDALAAFHAYWWNHPQLGKGFGRVRGWYNDKAAFEVHVQRRQREWAQFTAAGHEIPDEWRALYEHVLKVLPKLWEAYLGARIPSRRNLTLTHGDCYLTQFLVPTQGAGRTYLIDFQDVSANFAAYDLVYLIGTFWTAENHRAVAEEMDLLERYHCRLLERRITNYSLDALNRDFDMMLAFMLFDPVFNAVSGASQAYWLPKMRCLMALFAARDARVLLDRLRV